MSNTIKEMIFKKRLYDGNSTRKCLTSSKETSNLEAETAEFFSNRKCMTPSVFDLYIVQRPKMVIQLLKCTKFSKKSFSRSAL